MAEDLDVERARQDVRNAFNVFEKRPSRSKQKELQRTKERLRKTYLQAEEKELDELIKQVESADNQRRHGESWKIINKITGRKTAKKSMIKGKTKEERVETWFKHFKSLLGKKNDTDGSDEEEEEEDIGKVLDNLDIDDGPFSQSELQKAKKSLKRGKQTGSDNIAPEVLQSCNFDDILLSFANSLMVDDGEKPQQWSDIDLIPLPKSGDLTDTQNYRGISLISTVAKLINKMVLNRIQPKMDRHLRPNQNGFRPGRRTTSHILALRRLIEGVKSRNRKAVILYIDFRKAFDSINRKKMKKILKAYDIPPNLLNCIMKMYEDTRAKVISPDGETDFFQIISGVLQGDTLAPYLFVIVLDHVMCNIFNGKEEEFGFKLHRRRSSRIKPVTVTDLDFADDLAITTEDIKQAQEIMLRLEIEAEKVGLVCNADKTKFQSYNQDGEVTLQTKDGEAIKEVTNFKYLGGWTESTRKDIKIRKALAWSACLNLSKIWKSNLALKIKIRLFIATVESVLLYGSETWTMTKSLTKQIDGCYTRMLRMAKNVSWREHMRNEDMYGNLPKVSTKIKQRRMRLAGHCIRHEEEMANKLVLWEPTEGQRSRGRRKATYIDTLLEDACVDNISELRALMEEREEWWKHVENAGRPDGRPR